MEAGVNISTSFQQSLYSLFVAFQGCNVQCRSTQFI
jgi:hypothetical protein